MKGNNKMILNEATMVEALQFWLDSKWLPPVPKVTGVQRESNMAGVHTFEIALEQPEEQGGSK